MPGSLVHLLVVASLSWFASHLVNMSYFLLCILAPLSLAQKFHETHEKLNWAAALGAGYLTLLDVWACL